MEMKTIIYLVLGILYYAYKFNKNRKKKQDEQAQKPSEETFESYNEPKPQAVSEPQYEEPKGFQEMLEELVSEKPVERKEIIIEKEPVTHFDNTDWDKFQKSKADKKKVDIEEKEFKRFAEFGIEEEEENDMLTDLLSDKDAVKRAFVASEIFNRKY